MTFIRKMKRVLIYLLAVSIIFSAGLPFVYAEDSEAGKAMYENGMAAFEAGNYDTAFANFQIAGEVKGYVPALNMLGVCYRDGLGTEQNMEEAERYFNLAAEQGNEDAIANLAALEAAETAEQEAAYQAAIDLFLAGRYEEAKQAFETLDGYSRSEDYLAIIKRETVPDTPAVTALDAPTITSLTLDENNHPVVRWSAVNGASIYEVYYRFGSESSVLADTVNEPVISYIFEAADDGTDYAFKVCAVTEDGTRSEFSNEVSIHIPERTLLTPEPVDLEASYQAAIDLFLSDRLEEAKLAFEALNGYNRSADFLALIAMRSEVNSATQVKVGDYLTFGAYEQDSYTSNGKEPVEWLVLAVENNRALLISRYALDCKKYNETRADVTWETCALRIWLNNSFLKEAFSDEEQSQIITAAVSADKNPKYETDPGNETQDKIFLLSIDEAEKYFVLDKERSCAGTEYCYAQEAYKNSKNGNCWWWLRSPGGSSDLAADVLDDGSVYYYGNSVLSGFNAVRPALWLNLES